MFAGFLASFPFLCTSSFSPPRDTVDIQRCVFKNARCCEFRTLDETNAQPSRWRKATLAKAEPLALAVLQVATVLG